MLNQFFTLVLALSLSACFSPRIQHEADEAPKTPSSEQAAATETITVQTLPEKAVDTAPTVHASHPPENVTAEKAMQWLKNGNTRFLKTWYRKDGKSLADRQRLAAGQKPHTIVLSCADSRVPPEHVFDQALGEIFTIRVAGEALDSSVIASVEYAATHLGSRLVLVMGHTQCGAVAATIENKGRTPAGSPSLDRMVADLGPHVEYATPENKTADLYKESFDNAKGVAADLVSRSEIVRNLVAQGQLKIASAIYNLKTGKVDFTE